MARKKGAAGPSILRSNFRWTAVSAATGKGQQKAVARTGTANRVSRMRATTIAMPGSLLRFTYASDAPGVPLRSDKEHAVTKRKQNIHMRGDDRLPSLRRNVLPPLWNPS